MGSTGGTIGTPITGGLPTGVTLAEPIPYTLLSINRFSKIMGINPIAFAGANAGNAFPYGGTCNDLWFKYSWQDADRVGYMDLVHEIQRAEHELAQVLGWYPAPMWIEQEIRMFPRDYRVEFPNTSYGADGRSKSIDLEFGKLIQAGQRAVSLVGSATVAGGTLVYTDEDTDGFYETATITLATALTDAREIKLYYSGHDGEPDWEIRPVRRKVIGSGNIVITLNSWLLIDPELYETYPDSLGNKEPIDITTINNFVTSVDVYREYTDSTDTSATFYWEPEVETLVCTSCGGSGCPACTLTSQDGCIHIRNAERSQAVPTPATYDSTTGEWSYNEWTLKRAPDIVKVWYYAGAIDQRYTKQYTYDPLSHYWANVIARLAVARLERPFASCANLAALQEDLRTDLAFAASGTGNRFVTRNVQTSPFGTRKGEVEAWMAVSKFSKDHHVQFALV